MSINFKCTTMANSSLYKWLQELQQNHNHNKSIKAYTVQKSNVKVKCL